METGPERINSGQLVELLGMIRGARLVTITAETVPVLRQRSRDGVLCPWFDTDSKPGQSAGRRFSVRKIAAFSAAAVGQRRRGRLPETSARTWGKRRSGCPLVDYAGRLYLDVQKLRVLSCRFYDVTTGKTLTAPQLAPWITERAAGDVKWRDYLLERVRTVSTQGGRAFVLIRRGQRIRTTAECQSSRVNRRRAFRRPVRVRGA